MIIAEQLRLIETQHQTELWHLLKNHFAETYPKRAKTLGNEQLNQFIDLMCQKIRHYQIARKGQAKQFIELAAALGSHFDTDPMLKTWVEPYLTTINDNVAGLILLKQDLAPVFIARWEKI